MVEQGSASLTMNADRCLREKHFFVVVAVIIIIEEGSIEIAVLLIF